MADVGSTDELIRHVLLALGTGGASFFGAFLRFKARLKTAEDGLAKLKDLQSKYDQLEVKFNSLSTGLHLERENDKKFDEGVATALKEERASQPDPLEGVRRQMDALQTDVDRLKARKRWWE